jgi:WD40 repeat protein
LQGRVPPPEALRDDPDARAVHPLDHVGAAVLLVDHGRVVLADTGHSGSVDAVVIAPDGSWLASTGRDGSVRIWDPVTGRQRADLTGDMSLVNAIAITPDGSWLASAGGGIRIWDLATGQQRADLTGHDGPVNAVAITPDGSWLASGGHDRTVRIWDLATGQPRAVLNGHIDAVRAVAIAPDGSWLASGSVGSVSIWELVSRS